MKPRTLITSLALLPVLGASTVGCFHNVYPPPPVSGNWVTTVSLDPQDLRMRGALALSGLFDSVTGVAHMSQLPCVSSDTPLKTIGKQDVQTLKTKMSIDLGADNTMDVVGQQSEDGSAFNGTFTMKNPSCGGITAGNITAIQFGALSGTYAGSLNLSQGGTLSISTMLTQEKLADEGGKYPVSGTATIVPSQCEDRWAAANSFVAGDQFVATYISLDNSSQLQAIGKLSQDAKSVNITSFTITGGSCDGYTGAGLLLKQRAAQ